MNAEILAAQDTCTPRKNIAHSVTTTTSSLTWRATKNVLTVIQDVLSVPQVQVLMTTALVVTATRSFNPRTPRLARDVVTTVTTIATIPVHHRSSTASTVQVARMVTSSTTTWILRAMDIAIHVKTTASPHVQAPSTELPPTIAQNVRPVTSSMTATVTNATATASMLVQPAQPSITTAHLVPQDTFCVMDPITGREIVRNATRAAARHARVAPARAIIAHRAKKATTKRTVTTPTTGCSLLTVSAPMWSRWM